MDVKAKEFMSFAYEGALRMRRMIDDLLLYSRIETQGKALQKVDLEEVLAVVLKDLKRAIEESGASITFDPLPTVTADRTQMVQVFQNLIGNAVKFRAEEAPQIHVSARRGTMPGCCPFRTTASALTQSTGTVSSSCSSACTRRRSTRGPASALPS